MKQPCAGTFFLVMLQRFLRSSCRRLVLLILLLGIMRKMVCSLSEVHIGLLSGMGMVSVRLVAAQVQNRVGRYGRRYGVLKFLLRLMFLSGKLSTIVCLPVSIRSTVILSSRIYVSCVELRPKMPTMRSSGAPMLLRFARQFETIAPCHQNRTEWLLQIVFTYSMEVLTSFFLLLWHTWNIYEIKLYMRVLRPSSVALSSF